MKISSEQLYIVIVIARSFITNVIFIIKKKKYEKDSIFTRILKDKHTFISYVMNIAICMVFLFIYPEEFIAIVNIALHYMFIEALVHHSLMTKTVKAMGRDGYEKVIMIIDYMFTYAWCISIFRDLINLKIAVIDIAILVGVAVLSLLGLKELKKIESDYLSTM
ncbi:MAG: hypothetical protein IJN77_05840 [Oscillospiraceae bacterium]|nr:hypothetical protein [Oscillospiraceae bacterium]